MLLLTLLLASVGAILWWRLRRRVSRLERELQGLRQILAAVPVSALASTPLDASTTGSLATSSGLEKAAPSPQRTQAAATGQHAAAQPVGFDPVVGFIRANPFASAGIGLIVLGVGFLFSYLAVAGLMPPVVRVLGVAAVAAAMFAAGVHQQKRRAAFGENLQGGGLAVGYLSVLWTYQGYELLSAGAAFGLLAVLSAAAFGWGALRRQALFGFIGLLGALLAPVFASAGGVFAGLSAYALAIGLMSVGLAWRLACPELAAGAAMGACMLLGAATTGGITPGGASHAWISACGHLLLFAGHGLWSVRRSPSGHRLALAASNLVLGPLIAVLIAGYGARASNAAVASLLTLAAFAYLVHAWRTPAAAGAVVGGLGAAFGAAAMGVGLEGPTQVLTLAAGSFVMALMAAQRRQQVYEWAAVAYLTIAAAAGLSGDTITGMSAVVVAALAGAWVTRTLRVAGRVLALAAPVALSLVVHLAVGQPSTQSGWLLGEQVAVGKTFWLLATLVVYATAAEVAGTRLSWRALRHSAWWLAAFTLWVLADDDLFVAALGWRQLLLTVALIVLGMLGWRQHASGLTGRLFSSAQGRWLPLALPCAASLEIARLAGHAFASQRLTVLLTGICLVWVIWALVTRAAERRIGPNAVARASWGIAAAAASACALHVRAGVLIEAVQWASAAALVAAAWRASDWRGARFLVHAVLGAALLATVLREVAWLVYERPLSTWQALIEPVMQPWVSVLWALAGVAVVVMASREAQRAPWMTGAAALALLVLKMLAVDLSNVPMLARVVAFIVVGVLFLALGYLAPAPPAQQLTHPKAS